MTLPDDFETHDSGTFQVLDANAARIAQLEAQIDSLKREINALLSIKNLSRAELVELTDVIGNVQERLLRPDHVAV